jgi:hypothetical protein
MKTKILTQLFLLAVVSFSLYSCTADSVTDTKSQATEVTPSNPKTPTDVSLEEINTKPR